MYFPSTMVYPPIGGASKSNKTKMVRQAITAPGSCVLLQPLPEKQQTETELHKNLN